LELKKHHPPLRLLVGGQRKKVPISFLLEDSLRDIEEPETRKSREKTQFFL
jgi:hypothetical protein